MTSLTSIAQVTKRYIDCESPENKEGRVIKIRGVLNLTNHPNYPYPAKMAQGALHFMISESNKKHPFDEMQNVSGIYDVIVDNEYISVGSLPDLKIVTHINLTHNENSYVEYDYESTPIYCNH